MAGRPTKLTRVVCERIALLIRSGNTVEVAAAAAGISEASFFAWMDRGEEADTGIYREFYDAIEQARAESEALQVERISRAANNGSWQAAAWLLERRYSERWAKPADRRKLASDDTEKPADAFEEFDELAPRRKNSA